jgi:hypothetical protein
VEVLSDYFKAIISNVEVLMIISNVEVLTLYGSVQSRPRLVTWLTDIREQRDQSPKKRWSRAT